MDIKLIFFILSAVIGTAGFIPYIQDVLGRRTEPHIYTWLIWAITQGTAAALGVYGGGGLGAISLLIAALMNTTVFILAIKYGTKNITKFDTVILIGAFLAILVWWQLDQPLLAVIMITVIDFVGYIPTVRKAYEEPWTETVKSWLAYFVAMGFAILALKEYNWLTLFYSSMIVVSNLAMAILCIIRRRYVFHPEKR